tara:strand:+ start:2267 stop:4216 length:1950 start_codon:yes stop_codon:yes gene_type:complete
MAIKRYIATSDNTITNAYQMDLSTRGTGSNMGAADALEAFYIYGQVSSGAGAESHSAEKSRILVQFDIDKMNEDRTNGIIPASGSVVWQLNLYNAPHAFTLPKDFKMVVKVCSGSWQEGTGLDMDNYTDKTYESTGSNWVRKGAAGDGNSTWLTEGGDFAESHLSPAYTVSFIDGTEDLSVDISNIVEDWMAGGVKATGVLVTDESVISSYNGKGFTLTDSQGTTVSYVVNTSTATSAGSVIGASGLSTKAELAQAIADAINNTTQLRITAERNADNVTLTQDDLGLAGNAVGGLGKITCTGSDLTNGFDGPTDFANGTGIPNYGLGVFMSASYETGSHSYYTKKFFSRTSEYFFLRPNLEARWDSTTKDSAAYLIKSSSLVTAEENLNTLYFYNFVKGRLRDIPPFKNSAGVPQDGKVIHLSLFSNSSGLPVFPGDRLALPVGGGVVTNGHHNVTGGIVSTGIYSASFALTHSDGIAGFSGSVYPLWHFHEDQIYHTGSEITLKQVEYTSHNPDPRFVTTIENLKPIYSRREQARFRLFVRSKNWNPNNYTVVQSDPQSEVIEDAYFRLCRVVDDYEIISYGTGSATAPQVTGSAGSYTRLSYDISGNYFDLDMSMLQAGYEYELKLAYYQNDSYKEQQDTFKFKVEE